MNLICLQLVHVVLEAPIDPLVLVLLVNIVQWQRDLFLQEDPSLQAQQLCQANQSIVGIVVFAKSKLRVIIEQYTYDVSLSRWSSWSSWPCQTRDTRISLNRSSLNILYMK